MADARNTVDEPQRKREREEDLWFDDGSVILVAQDREFRVHRSLPSRDSLHDCAVVLLSDDAGYLRSLLSVIYDRDFYKESSLDRMAYHERVEISTGVMCLAHKYDMNDLFSEAYSRLQEIYPMSLYTFTRLGHVHSDMHARIGGSAALLRLTNAARAIPAPELNTMLPTLFYLCAQLEDEVLLNGAPREDGTLERLQPITLAP
ncbi:uncharacterized protein B0H18DRAFT_1116924 [Fomitopsis serialis]|uniref:uncharacterized protein n=1 Tax=Fomitopsis serialis TaxID=139415 RepID=UPI002007CCD9|nr:uncharacterized protein B0H18DRAFT_1116924 [Neoantrodia serialis]KAH9930228.1 hypothetical protein B0H18DRAFT_1116924 [Neoantrodia serialis]